MRAFSTCPMRAFQGCKLSNLVLLRVNEIHVTEYLNSWQTGLSVRCTIGNHVHIKSCSPSGTTDLPGHKNYERAMVYQRGIAYASPQGQQALGGNSCNIQNLAIAPMVVCCIRVGLSVVCYNRTGVCWSCIVSRSLGTRARHQVSRSCLVCHQLLLTATSGPAKLPYNYRWDKTRRASSDMDKPEDITHGQAYHDHMVRKVTSA